MSRGRSRRSNFEDRALRTWERMPDQHHRLVGPSNDAMGASLSGDINWNRTQVMDPSTPTPTTRVELFFCPFTTGILARSIDMDALSSEWRLSLIYQVGDRVAFKLGDSLGVAAFECTHKRESKRHSSRHYALKRAPIYRFVHLVFPCLSYTGADTSTYNNQVSL
jgi:hypothetical protein